MRCVIILTAFTVTLLNTVSVQAQGASGVGRSGAPNQFATIRGAVLSHDGKPVAGANLWLDPPTGELPTHTGDWQTDRPDGWTFDQGRFAIFNKPAGKYRLTVWLGKQRVHVQPIELKAGQELKVDITLPPLPTLQGTLLDADGTPMANVRLLLRKEDGDTRFAVTDKSGEFVFFAPPTGKAMVSVVEDSRELLKQEVEVRGEQGESLTLRLPPLPSVSLRIMNPDSTPLANSKVSVTIYPFTNRELVTDADGRGVLTRLPPASYKVLLRAGKDGWAIVSFTLKPNEKEKALDVPLQPGASVSGQVITPDSKPVANVDVSISPHSPNPFNIGNLEQKARTDAQGRFVIEGLWAGTYGLRVMSQEDRPGLGQSLWLLPGQQMRDLTVIVVAAQPSPAKPSEKPDGSKVTKPRPVTVVGRVLDANGKPVAEATVQLNKMLPSQFGFDDVVPGAPVTTDAQGKFTLANVPPGWHVVSARVKDGRDTIQWVNVPDNNQLASLPTRPLTVVLRLPKRTGTVRGRVLVDGGKTPVAGVGVMAIESNYLLSWDSEQAALSLQVDASRIICAGGG